MPRHPLALVPLADSTQATGAVTTQVTTQVGMLLSRIEGEMTLPDKPRSSNQRYRLTPLGQRWLQMQSRTNAS